VALPLKSMKDKRIGVNFHLEGANEFIEKLNRTLPAETRKKLFMHSIVLIVLQVEIVLAFLFVMWFIGYR